MAASGLASIADASAARGPPALPTRWALVLLGLAAAATSFTLALLSEDVSGTLGEPLLIAALTAWSHSPTWSAVSSRGGEDRRTVSARC
jgi:hypothetical protein